MCILIGAAVLIAPHFLSSPGWRDTIAGAHVVGWFALVLGVGGGGGGEGSHGV